MNNQQGAIADPHEKGWRHVVLRSQLLRLHVQAHGVAPLLTFPLCYASACAGVGLPWQDFAVLGLHLLALEMNGGLTAWDLGTGELVARGLVPGLSAAGPHQARTNAAIISCVDFCYKRCIA